MRHLKYPLEKYHGDVNLTLVAHNAGEAAVRRSAGVPNARITSARSPLFILQDHPSLYYGVIARNRVLAAIPCMFNEMSGHGLRQQHGLGWKHLS